MTLKTTKKVGLLGAGYILDSHASALLQIPQASLHAVCDVSSARTERAAAKYGIAHRFNSLQQLAASDCDVVHILLPPGNHIEAALTLLDAGKSVFLEKPMGLDSAACQEVSRLADANGLSAGVNHNFLFSPGYERLRSQVKRGAFGRLDQLTVCWHYGLPLLQFGPFDSWMLAAPANIMFELGSHLAAFIIDLVGPIDISSATAANPIELPARQRVYRHWTAVGQKSATNVLLSISIATGQADRVLRLRGRGGSATLDFGRDISWQDFTSTDNPIFDAYETASSAGRTLLRQARNDRRRRIRAALGKRADANPFEETIFRSISAFYAGLSAGTDPRHRPEFGANVIKLCESVATVAGAGAPSRTSVDVRQPQCQTQPSVLIVGGTGFIGRRLTRKLVDAGYGVRILTRNPRAAAIEFEDLPVEILGGSHGNRETAERALSGVHTVYHLAKCEGKRWQDYIDGDIEPTRTLALAAVEAGIKRFIYTGTIASYASANPRDVIDNRTGLDPAIDRRGHYARSKAKCEALLQEMQRGSGLPLVILRPGIVIGPGTPPAHLGVGRFSSETRVRFWGDGSTPLPLVLVDDVADALFRAMTAAEIVGQTLLLTSPPLLNAREYVAELAACMDTQIDSGPRAAWRNWLADLLKEVMKNLVRHPNRRWPTLHDWQCQSHGVRYDGSMSEAALNWKPVSTREELVRRGIAGAVQWYLR